MTEEGTTGEGFERSFFAEKDQVQEILDSLATTGTNLLEDRAEQIRRILDRYQEQPQLLGPHTEDLLTPLNVVLVQYIEEQKHVDNLIRTVCKIIHTICKVRGQKQCSKYLPHEVHQLEPCVRFLNSLDPKCCSIWEVQYVLLLWLSTLCLIPFDLSSLDSSNSSEKLVRDLLHLSKAYLGSSGPSRQAAAICISSLLTRPDMQSNLLEEYLQWAVDTMNNFTKCRTVQSQFLYLGCLHSLTQIFKKGHREKLISFVDFVLESAVLIFDQAEQMIERKYLAKLLQRLGMTLLPNREASWRYQRGKRSLNFLNSHVVVFPDSSSQPIELESEELSGEISPWLEDVIDKLLIFLGDKDTVVRWSSAKGIGRIAMRLPKSFGDEIVGAIISMFDDENDDCRWHGGCLALAELTRRGLLLPEKLPEVVPLVAKALHFDILKGQHGIGSHVRDSAAYVCWSFARAYAPVVMSSYVRDLSVSMLTAILFDREVNCRRAAAAAFQENVGRQGNENFPHGIEIITIADFFSVGNRQSCFLELAPQISLFGDHLFSAFLQHIVDRKLCHWDEEIRDLAAKSLGKFLYVNKCNFDYNKLIEKLVSQAEHSSLAVRHGSLLGLGRLVLALSLRRIPSSEFSVKCVIDFVLDVEKKRIFRGRGGEMVREAVCVLVGALGQCGVVDSLRAHVSLVEFLNDQLRQPHFSVQSAAQNALRHCLFAFFGDHSKGEPSERLQKLTVGKYLDGLVSEQNVAATRGYAMGLGALCSRLLLKPSGILSKVISTLARFADSTMRISGEYDAETCKFCIEAAIEIFEKVNHHVDFDPSFTEKFLEIFLRGCEDYNVDKRGDTGSWSRIASLRAFERFVHSLHSSVQSETLESSFGVICESSMDENPYLCLFGENSVGRKAAVEMKWISSDPLRTPILLSYRVRARFDSCSLNENDANRMYSYILKQLSEKLNNVREVAGQVLSRVALHRKSYLCWEIDIFVDELLGKVHSNRELIDWTSPEQSFPLVCNSLVNQDIAVTVLEGLIVSIGGLTESISREATRAFLEQRRFRETFPLLLKSTVENMVVIFGNRFQDDRVVLPLLKTIETFYRHGIFNDIDPTTHAMWNDKLYELLRRQLSSSTNVAKLIVIIDIVVMVVSGVHDNVFVWRHQASLLVNLLTHKYPRIRKC